MEFVTQVQILEEDVCASFHSNALGEKKMKLSFLLAMSK